jgi:hypothetical protein
MMSQLVLKIPVTVNNWCASVAWSWKWVTGVELKSAAAVIHILKEELDILHDMNGSSWTMQGYDENIKPAPHS